MDAAFTHTHAYFLIGSEEYRIGTLANPNYPATANVLPEVHPGAGVLAVTEVFENAVKQGTQVSTMGTIRLEFESDQISIRAWHEGDVGKSFLATVPVEHTFNFVPGRVLINGKHLVQALKLAKSENVKLGYGDTPDPLRIDAGNFVTCIWQMAVIQ